MQRDGVLSIYLGKIEGGLGSRSATSAQHVAHAAFDVDGLCAVTEPLPLHVGGRDSPDFEVVGPHEHGGDAFACRGDGRDQGMTRMIYLIRFDKR